MLCVDFPLDGPNFGCRASSRPGAAYFTAIAAGSNATRSAETFRELGNWYPEVNGNTVNLQCPEPGKRNTLVADAKGIAEIIMRLLRRQAARVRCQAAELRCRYLGGDLSLVDEVCALRGFQEELAVRAPQDVARTFGESVEPVAAPSAEPFTCMH